MNSFYKKIVHEDSCHHLWPIIFLKTCCKWTNTLTTLFWLWEIISTILKGYKVYSGINKKCVCKRVPYSLFIKMSLSLDNINLIFISFIQQLQCKNLLVCFSSILDFRQNLLLPEVEGSLLCLFMLFELWILSYLS